MKNGGLFQPSILIIWGIGMSDIAIKASEPLTLRAQLTEDWLAVVIGLLVFGAALVSISGTDVLGWAVTTSVYTDLARALGPFAKGYAWLGGGRIKGPIPLPGG